ncbi:dynein regulatory complex subunit 3 [Centroberyx gerrardi]|uniref:dynein regulatory complex subunit 3 n=1 Tax=Centroberyx gerrardi TaxID=166262 RepID=UPI003AAA3945
MSRRYGKVEPSVVDEEMLQKAVEEQGPQEQAGRIAKEEGIRFNEVLQLRLAYRDILKIDHLWEFTSLTKLELNNNIIKKIEGLDRLTNLTWLNLSFNNIEKIEGLESLVKLEVLNLYNNRISVIENMENLEKLTFFSIANNLLGQLDNVIYLRKFKNLHTLNLYGNTICKEENYKCFIAAYLKDLMYLDYRLLDEQTKNQASAKYQYAIEEVRRIEFQEQQAVETSQSQEAELQLHRDAFVEFLNGSYLFDSMFTVDPEAEKLHCLPGVADLLQTFEHQLVELCVQVFEIGLDEHKLRETEVKCFLSGEKEAVADNQQRAAQMVANFEQHRRKWIVETRQVSDTNLLDVKLSHYSNEIDQLCNSLMALEIQMVIQLEDIIKDFEMNISDMVGNFIETVQGIFAQCRDLENSHHEKLREIAVATLEKVAKNESEEDMTDEVRMLFSDKDLVMNALAASHDTHLLKINNRENQLVTRVNAWKAVLIKGIQDKEMKRHRKRISEIHNYMDYLREQLDDFLFSKA